MKQPETLLTNGAVLLMKGRVLRRVWASADKAALSKGGWRVAPEGICLYNELATKTLDRIIEKTQATPCSTARKFTQKFVVTALPFRHNGRQSPPSRFTSQKYFASKIFSGALLCAPPPLTKGRLLLTTSFSLSP